MILEKLKFKLNAKLCCWESHSNQSFSFCCFYLHCSSEQIEKCFLLLWCRLDSYHFHCKGEFNFAVISSRIHR